MDFQTKKEKSEYFRKKFFNKWGTYENFLEFKAQQKELKRRRKKYKRHRDGKLYLKIHKTNKGDELWISPEGTKKEYFLTKGKISLKEVNSWRPKMDGLFRSM